MRRYKLVWGAVIVILVGVSVLSLALYNQTYLSRQGSNNSKTDLNTSFFETEPVGDVIIPSISTSQKGGVANDELNVTQGETVSFTVEIFLEASENVTMNFHLFNSNTSVAQPLSVTFLPTSMNVSPEKSGASNMTIHVSSTAQEGTYTAVVSAVSTNSVQNYSWGTSVQIAIN